jgi:hypothetical protein
MERVILQRLCGLAGQNLDEAVTHLPRIVT